MEVKGSRAVTLSDVKEILEKREKETELGYEQSQALEHAGKFVTIDSKQAEKLVASITKNGSITEEIALKIVEIMPKDVATLKAILAKDKIEMPDEELNNIIKELS